VLLLAACTPSLDAGVSSFGHNGAHTQEAQRWLLEQSVSNMKGMKMSDLEGYDEVLRKALAELPPEQVLATYKPKQRVAGLPPEQVLAMFNSEQVVLALPDDALRSLGDDYLATLSEPTRAAIRARIGR
jgi:hypothetical protein